MVRRLKLLLLYLVAVLPSSLLAEMPRDVDSSPLKIRQLILQLGAADSHHREQASLQLAEIGMPAQRWLLEATHSQDAEICRRARLLLSHLLQVDLDRRIDEFAAHIESTPEPNLPEPNLPGWRGYRKLVGDSIETRRLFVAMIRAEPLLLETLEYDPREVVPPLLERAKQLYSDISQHRDPNDSLLPSDSIGRLAAIYTISCHSKVQVEQNLARAVDSLMDFPESRVELKSGTYAATLRRLLGAWMTKSASATSCPRAYQNMSLALEFNIREGTAPAQFLIALNRDASTTQRACLVLAKLGGKKNIEAMLPLLESPDTLPLVRDTVLLSSIHLSGLDPKNFYFAQLREDEETLFEIDSIRIEAVQRKPALQKWRNYWNSRRASEK